MNTWLGLSLLLLAMYLLGGIPFGYMAGRLKGIDIRKEGSGNIGATNVFRVMGRGWGIPVFTLDFAKAFVPLMWLKSGYVAGMGWALPVDLTLILAGVAVVMGHNYTPYLGFKGGKGMATSSGFLFAMLPAEAVGCVVVWVIVFYASRYVSLASISASLALPLWALVFSAGQWWLIGAAALLGVLGVVRHHSNIRRLLNGTEARFKKRSETVGGGATASSAGGGAA